MSVIPQHVKEFLDRYEGPTLAVLPHEGSRMNSRSRTLRVSDVRYLLQHIETLQELVRNPIPIIVHDSEDLAELPRFTVLQSTEQPHLIYQKLHDNEWRNTAYKAALLDSMVVLPAKVLT